MNSVYHYLKREGVYWIAAMALFLLSGLARQADAQPALQTTAAGMSFYKDARHGDWVIRYKNVPTAMDEDFADIDVVWRYTHEGNPLVLIAGHLPGQCSTTYRLYWGQLTGDIRQAKFTDICNAKDIKVGVSESTIRVSFDGKVKRIPLN